MSISAVKDTLVTAGEEGAVCNDPCNDPCSVCTGSLSDGRHITVLQCNGLNGVAHIVHTACLERWLHAGQFTCPLCRTVYRGLVDEMTQEITWRAIPSLAACNLSSQSLSTLPVLARGDVFIAALLSQRVSQQGMIEVKQDVLNILRSGPIPSDDLDRVLPVLVDHREARPIIETMLQHQVPSITAIREALQNILTQEGRFGCCINQPMVQLLENTLETRGGLIPGLSGCTIS